MHGNPLEQLRIPCTVAPYEATAYLPLYLRGSYHLYKAQTNQVIFLIAQPVDSIPLPTLRKHWTTLATQSGFPCAFYFESLKPYKKEKLIDAGIPFIIKKTAVFLPFLGIALSTRERKLPEGITKCSMLTQKFLLMVLYQQVHQASASQIANLLGVSRMSGTRCIDEIEVLFPALVQRNGNRRIFVQSGLLQNYWELIKPRLQNPVIREYRLDISINMALPLGGISAVCHYSMLDEGHTRIYCVTKTMAADMELSSLPQVPLDEIPSTIVQVLGYTLPFHNQLAIDPLSAILSLTPEEMKDPRVEGAMQEIEESFFA